MWGLKLTNCTIAQSMMFFLGYLSFKHSGCDGFGWCLLKVIWWLLFSGFLLAAGLWLALIASCVPFSGLLVFVFGLVIELGFPVFCFVTGPSLFLLLY